MQTTYIDSDELFCDVAMFQSSFALQLLHACMYVYSF